MFASVTAALSFALLSAPAVAEEPHPVVAAVKAKLKHPDKPFTMLVMIKVKPGMEGQFEAAFAEAIKATRKEKGNIAYDLNRSAEHGNFYAVYERWKNLPALEEHIKSKHIEKLLKTIDPLLEEPPQVNVGIPVGE